MSIFRDILQGFLPKTNMNIKQSSEDGLNSIDNNKFANKINETNYYNPVIIHSELQSKRQIEEIFDSSIDNNISIKLKEAILPIELLLNQGKIQLAIEKYKGLIDVPYFSTYSRDEHFLIYSSILYCYIYGDNNKEEINHWIFKIKSLGEELKELHKFYYLLCIKEYNEKNFENALININKSLSLKSDYINAIVIKIILNISYKFISYEDAKRELNKLILQNDLSIKENSFIYSAYGDIAISFNDYRLAMEYYVKSNKFVNSILKEINIVICEYYLSFNILEGNDYIALEDINFDDLKIAENKFEKIYNSRTDESIYIIVKKSFPFYLYSLTINGKYKKILEIYRETSSIISGSMKELFPYIIEAQIINGILDEELLGNLNDLEQIEFEILYYEKLKKPDEIIKLLTPVFQGKYKNKKLLQLSYLKALRETNEFKKYMEFYQKFSLYDDEFMKLDYIKFLMKMEQKEKVLKELKVLKQIVKHPIVIYEMFIIYLEYELVKELDDFFVKIDTGEYKLIDLQKPFVFFKKMFHLLNKEEYGEYFKKYETEDLTILSEENRIILTINYYIFKNNLNKLGDAYYKYFEHTQNHNDLIKAVQSKLQINDYYNAEFFLEQINPMLLDDPEYYYIFKVLILDEKGNIEDAFKELEIVKELLDLGPESLFHQFYFQFNMHNNRVDEAIIYMNEYTSENPNPSWFKTIKISEDETTTEFIDKLDKAIGGNKDLSIINNLFNNSLLGISVYNKLTGISIEEIILSKNYPFTKISIAKGQIIDIESITKKIDKRIIIDATTLTILSSVNALKLLDEFDEIIIPYSTIVTLTERKGIILETYAKDVLDYLGQLPNIKKIAVDEIMKIKGEITKILNQDILDCISLSENLKIPFFNSEIFEYMENNGSQTVDINEFFGYFKYGYPEQRTTISITIAKMRELGLDFISFDSNDIYNVYKSNGIKGIKPFLKMGKNADYNTFSIVYVMFLNELYKKNSFEEFKECSIEIIKFMDKYVGKTRYYLMGLIHHLPSKEKLLLQAVENPSLKNIIHTVSSYEISHGKTKENINIKDTLEFNKITNILSAFSGFVFQFISIFNDNEEEKEKYKLLLIQNLVINMEQDIKYILDYKNKDNKKKNKKQTRF